LSYRSQDWAVAASDEPGSTVDAAPPAMVDQAVVASSVVDVSPPPAAVAPPAPTIASPAPTTAPVFGPRAHPAPVHAPPVPPELMAPGTGPSTTGEHPEQVPVITDFPPAEPPAPEGVVDPNGLATFVALLSPESLRAGRVALGVLSAMLRPDERVEALVQGIYQGHMAVGALTAHRVILVNEHEWVPDIRSIPLRADLAVQGWQDDRLAALMFVSDGQTITLSDITDRPLAHEFAHVLRTHVASLNE
jgi:hypothetical protein